MSRLTGLAADELWRLWLSSPAVRQFETGQVDSAVFATQLIAEFGLDIEASDFLAEFVKWPSPIAGAGDLVRQIPAGIKRATLTNSNAVHWGRLEEMGLEGVFDRHFASHLTGNLKPDLHAFEHCANVLECDPKTVLFLDDLSVNVDAAERAGFLAAQVNGVNGARDALVAFGILS